MVARGNGDRKLELGNKLKLLTAKNSVDDKPVARTLSLIVATCFCLFAGLWFTWTPILLTRVITDPQELLRFRGVETVVFVGLTGILIYVSVQITFGLLTSKIQLQSSEEDLLKRLGLAAEWRDDETSDHTLRVGEYCELMAKGLGWDEVAGGRIRKAGMLHDIGKIGIPDFVMIKTDEFTVEDRNLMQAHTLLGSELLADSNVPMIQMAQRIAASHHERWDGQGYPYGLEGEQIPLEGRIAAIADVFDALTSRRRYKAAWSFEDAVEEIEKSSGTQFDPSMVQVFLEKKDEFRQVYGKYSRAARSINVNRAA